MAQTMNDSEDYEQKIALAIMQAIVDASRVETEQGSESHMNGPRICSALVTALATVMEDSPDCQTPKQIRAAADQVSKRLFREITEVRKALREDPDTAIFGGKFSLN